MCVDLDARGGALYNVLVVPMMTGTGGQKSIDVDPAQLARAAPAVTPLGRGSIEESTPAIADAAEVDARPRRMCSASMSTPTAPRS